MAMPELGALRQRAVFLRLWLPWELVRDCLGLALSQPLSLQVRTALEG
jgi:hypothetical protein